MAVVTGNNADNLLNGTAQADTLLGLGGNDFLFGSAGNDTLDGGAGNDFAVYTGSPNGLTIDLVAGTATGWGSDRLIGIEHVDGSFQNDRISLSDANNFANGNGGNDTIWGLGGTDNLLGGNGNDRLYAGTGNAENLDGQEGNDFVAAGVGHQTRADGGDGIDTLSYADASPARGLIINFTYNTMFTYTAANTLISQQIYNFEHLEASSQSDNVLGSAGNNRILGLAGNDTLDGWNGNDTLDGGAGNDTVLGGNGNDSVIGGAGSDKLYGGDGNDTVLGGGDSDTLYGGVGNDVLRGGAAADTIYAGEGSDTMFGEGGNDVLFGSNGGTEVFVGGAGQDIMHGFAGADRFVFNNVSESAVGVNRDQIVDFFRSEGDKIDLSAIDARTNQAGDQAFSFIGSNAFSAAGQLRVVHQGGSEYLVQANVDANLAPDMEIWVSFLSNAPAAQDFIL
jgi:Ca2+-binding RTX toxin-like protein